MLARTNTDNYNAFETYKMLEYIYRTYNKNVRYFFNRFKYMGLQKVKDKKRITFYIILALRIKYIRL